MITKTFVHSEAYATKGVSYKKIKQTVTRFVKLASLGKKMS
jgi:hypothetical protein